jgi:hypothetical protein
METLLFPRILDICKQSLRNEYPRQLLIWAKTIIHLVLFTLGYELSAFVDLNQLEPIQSTAYVNVE